MTAKKNKNIKDEKLRFEMMLSEISASFINVPYKEIDDVIRSSLKCFVIFLDFDRASIFQRVDMVWERTHV
ncbi:MAG: hypothetical protein KJN80_05810, partial [Deltaproteobacteria bacterium]|nr:hypothetical protein [Deltaproteobacteria bacterium]